MFTGIIEATGVIRDLRKEGTNTHYRIESSLSSGLKIDQSVSHDGVCLTVTKVDGNNHWVTAIDETLKKSNLSKYAVGKKINLERCMLNNGRFDGHIVQGHVDQTAIVTEIVDEKGSWLITFEYEKGEGNITVEKGSVAVNGVSLTCFNSKESSFTVAIIPYTYDNTNFHELKKDDVVNLEFDIIGKYVKKLLASRP